MKVLCVNSLYSKYGGVEFAAANLAFGLAVRGHEVHFLSAKGQQSQFEPHGGGASAERKGCRPEIHQHTRVFPRNYPLGEKHGLFRKLLWHVQDLMHPRNKTLFAGILEEIRPDIIILHNLTAVGLNIWRTIGTAGIPCIQVIHDLNLICLNMARFKSGRQCSGLCTACRLQKLYRFSLIAGASNFSFVSPSRATLDCIEEYVDLSKWKRRVISNANTFRVKARKPAAGEKPRLLYVGRLDPSKGVGEMLQAAELAHEVANFELDILGTGPLEMSLRQKYGSMSWINIRGSVDQEFVAEFMSRATVLLVPSLWLETVPGVAVHALFADLPVLGSRIGGIPEHVGDGITGRLLPPGDIQAWSDEIVRVVSDPQQVAIWSGACAEFARKFDPARALDEYETLMHEMVA